MKIFSTLKNETKKVNKSIIEKLDKTQIQQIIGGADTSGIKIIVPVAMEKEVKI